MSIPLSKKELEMILESLKYTKLKFEDYQEYPNYEFKQGKVKEVQDVISKVDRIIKEMK